MVEKNVKDNVKEAKKENLISIDEWLDRYLNEKFLKGTIIVETTFGPKKSIPEWQAAFVFQPIEARGTNGVAFEKIIGIADLKWIILQLCTSKQEKITL
jgi:hypothetical protein